MPEYRGVEEITFFQLDLPFDDVGLGPLVALDADIPHARLKDADLDDSILDLDILYPYENITVLLVFLPDALQSFWKKTRLKMVPGAVKTTRRSCSDE